MIYMLPWGDENTASSRLRVYSVLSHLGASLELPEQYQKGDVLIIQKALKPMELLKAKSQGAKVIYDIDDNFLDHGQFVWMADNADVVTVGSAYFHKWYPNAPVIDDTLDWDGTVKVERKTCAIYGGCCGDWGLPKDKPNECNSCPCHRKLLGWHGYGNLKYIDGIAPVFKKLGYTIRTIVQEPYLEHYKDYDARVWNLKTIDKDLAECDMCAFFLPKDDFSQAKGMNKLIKAWAIGLPCYVSPTVEYERVMREAGIEGFIVKDWKKHDFSGKWEPKMREYALKYSPENVSKQWKAVIDSL